MINVKLGFHITDWLSLAGVGMLNVTPRFKTSFNERLMEVLPDKKLTDPNKYVDLSYYQNALKRVTP